MTCLRPCPLPHRSKLCRTDQTLLKAFTLHCLLISSCRLTKQQVFCTLAPQSLPLKGSSSLPLTALPSSKRVPAEYSRRSRNRSRLDGFPPWVFFCFCCCSREGGVCTVALALQLGKNRSVDKCKPSCLDLCLSSSPQCNKRPGALVGSWQSSSQEPANIL